MATSADGTGRTEGAAPAGSIKRLRVVVVGPGGIAQKAHLPVLVDLPEVEVIGLYGRSRERTRPVAERFRVPMLTGSLGDALDRACEGGCEGGAEAAVVLTATENHVEASALALERGLDVLVEKPVSRSLEDARALVRQAEERQRILMVAFNRRHAPIYAKTRWMLAGQPGLVAAEKLRTHAGDSLAEAVIDDAIHQIDLLRWFGGEVDSVQATAEERGGIFRSLVVGLRFAGGGMGSLVLSHVAGAWSERLTCHEGRRTLEVLNMDALEVSQGGATTRQGFSTWTPVLERRGFVEQARHFAACCRDRQEPLTSGRDALRTQELATRIIEAIR
ncbi:MAG: Gfo/Idh/MocA family oxidoreductase [Firmicutes bacterium]|nr:Gfo/Idh/MocA family oxidoreductase [Bacillota bacterium]